jgi:hypothetical protein
MMSKEVNRTVSSCCTLKDTGSALPFDSFDVVEWVKGMMEKKLLKKGIALRWTNAWDSPELVVNLVEIDPGNQALRWLVPFVSPAVLEVEGKITFSGSPPQPFHYVQKVHFGLFGGTPKSMLKVCADRITKKIIQFVLHTLPL